MHDADGRIVASPTDLANFLACRHKTSLDLLVVEGRLQKPTWVDPLAKVLQQRGEEHERQYVDRLRRQGLTVVDLGAQAREGRPAATLEAMRAGVDAIAQAALSNHHWLGYADVLRRVNLPSALGAWSYEAVDTKLTRETRGATMLQLCVYSALLEELQQRAPAAFHVVTPAADETYRFHEFGAFFRQTRARFIEFLASRRGREDAVTYPDPVAHCDVCRWSMRCTKRRRADDHLTFVAGLGRSHAAELEARQVTTMATLAALPVPLEFKPTRGSRETFERLREQARLQVERRTSGGLPFEFLPLEAAQGFMKLPEPRPGDLFLDLEGDPFGRPGVASESGETSREYLFGLGRVGVDGEFAYVARWAFTDGDERQAFEAVTDDVIAAIEADPGIHVYHYAPYEPAAFKRLAGRYAAREADLDRLLRGDRFVDLYAVVRQAIRAGVERYSIKDLEPYYGFARSIDLSVAGDERRLVELALETGDLALVTESVRHAVQTYNRDDVRSTFELRQWLERLRQQRVDAGEDIPRPPLEPGEASERVTERQQRVAALRARLLEGVPSDRKERTPEQRARFVLAYLLDWHYREDKVVWWEYFRLLELSDDELIDERSAVSGLAFVDRVDRVKHKKTGKPTGSVVDRYRFPLQECDLRPGDELTTRDQKKLGTVVAIDRIEGTIDIQKGPSAVEVHARSAFSHERISPDVPAASLFRLGERAAQPEGGGIVGGRDAAFDLLLRRSSATRVHVNPGELQTDFAVRVVGDLAGTTLPIQGPPGSGKTYTGARMICELVRHGKRVGVTATGHKVIRNLLHAVASEARGLNQPVRLGRKVTEADEAVTDIRQFDGAKGSEEALAAIAGGHLDVLGGTAWLWSRPDAVNQVDVLFVDEAGQMALANALASAQAAPALVLLGDPQQLEQPQRGSHPDGVDVSALDHVLEGHQTMPEDRGLFLPTTWRLAPAICRFTSEVFYEGKLEPREGLEHQALVGAGRFDGAGLFVVPVAHEGNRNASDEEAEAVFEIASALLATGAQWVDAQRREHRLGAADILVVAPYNAHVARVTERLRMTAATSDVRVGTVDKFQGQEAPVVIYTMATSRPEDAPRGMEFLYSLNRLNVATSRAKCVSILVCNPDLFDPECQTPRQMRLANALARFRELARA